MIDYKYFTKHIKVGNTKLPATTAVFNMGAATDCPSDALGLCQNSDICYAKKAERQYTAVLDYRRRQEAIWNSITASQFVEWFWKWASKKRTPITELRFNESGDFWTAGCISKVERIAEALAEGGVDVYMYTARSDLDFSQSEWAFIRGSNFYEGGLVGSFTTVEEQREGEVLCPADCNDCSMCISTVDNIDVLKH